MTQKCPKPQHYQLMKLNLKLFREAGRKRKEGKDVGRFIPMKEVNAAMVMMFDLDDGAEVTIMQVSLAETAAMNGMSDVAIPEYKMSNDVAVNQVTVYQTRTRGDLDATSAELNGDFTYEVQDPGSGYFITEVGDLDSSETGLVTLQELQRLVEKRIDAGLLADLEVGLNDRDALEKVKKEIMDLRIKAAQSEVEQPQQGVKKVATVFAVEQTDAQQNYECSWEDSESFGKEEKHHDGENCCFNCGKQGHTSGSCDKTSNPVLMKLNLRLF